MIPSDDNPYVVGDMGDLNLPPAYDYGGLRASVPLFVGDSAASAPSSNGGATAATVVKIEHVSPPVVPWPEKCTASTTDSGPGPILADTHTEQPSSNPVAPTTGEAPKTTNSTNTHEIGHV